MQWINKGILFFILLFAFEPILSSSNIYWYLLAVSASIVFLIFIGFILGIFIKKIPIKNNRYKRRENILWISFSFIVRVSYILYI
ncbi:Uncharacterised protein [uncultured Prevotella sp.]|nr:Uncharacterised protein [uncultured Prevotella sp.]